MPQRLRPFPAVLTAALLALAPAALALDPPHDASNAIACRDCHIQHDDPAAQIDNPSGNKNLCLSCHQVGGAAGVSAFGNLDQAVPATGLPSGVQAGGTSHRWDSNPSGRAVWLGDRSLDGADGALVAGGTYTGRYARTYLITITAAGTARTAKFDWSASGPAGASGTGLTAGNNVPIESGLTLTFLNWRRGATYQVGDQWRVFARPDLIQPDDLGMQWTMVGTIASCSTCHDVHGQQPEPFDPNAPTWPIAGANGGRHCLRVDNDANQLCAQCHAPRFVTSATEGSHPIGITVPNTGWLHPPTSLPLDKVENKMWCSTCHQMHGSAAADGSLIRTASQGNLCGECHTFASANSPASHLTALGGPLWPGGQYGSLFPAVTDATQRGACGNCHQAHGWPDPSSPTNDYPSLLVESGENLCFTCHDGHPQAKDLKTLYTKTYKHPVALTGRHSPGEGGDPASYGIANRHSECADCHNVHALTQDTYPATAPTAAGALKSVARVSVENVATNQITYTFRGADDPTPVKEYELCFTCHSGWTTQPAGQANYAAKFNTLNASFHPVEGPGKNLNIHPGAFTNGWSADKTMFCTDCHTSDDPTIRGPHASTNQYILKQPATASSARRAMNRGEACFDCHRFDTYANKDSAEAIRGYSRFNKPIEGKGHTFHVHEKQYPCYACHDTHGSADKPHLIVTGRNPGITTYIRTETGGTCVATCHGSKNYKINYPR